MALFQGEDIIDVTTPDGRTLKLPRSAVPASLLQQQQMAPGIIGPTSYTAETPAPAPDPTSVTGGQIPTQDAQVLPDQAPVQNTPDFKVADPVAAAKKSAPARAAQDKKDAKARAADAAAKASPNGQMKAADQQTQSGYDAEKAATVDAALVEGAAQDLLGQAHEEANQRIDELFVKRDADAQQAMVEEAQQNEKIADIRKKIANTKIDREADHPIIGALSIALAGLGSAMQNRYTGKAPDMTALDIFWKSIDRKVAKQMGDLDLMEKTYGMSKDELGDMQTLHGRKLEMHNALIAGEADKAKRHLEEIIAKSASDKTKANAKILIAQIDQRAAAAHSDAVRWGLEYNQRDKHQQQQMSLGWFNAKEGQRANMMGEQLKREDMYLDFQKYMAQLKSQGDTEAYKAALKQTEEVGKRGIRDMNGELFVTPQAKAMLQQADQLEAEAAKTEAAGQADPLSFGIKGGKQRVEMLRERAAQLRGEANLHGAILAHSDTEAINIGNAISGGQSTVQLIDQIKSLAQEAGRGAISRDEAQVKLQSLFGQLKPALKDAWQLGAWDKGSANLVSEIIGFDPSSEWNAGTMAMIMQQRMYEDPNAFTARLDGVAEQLERSAKNKLIGLGAKFGEKDTVLQRQPGLDMNTPEAKAAGALKGATPTDRAEEVANSAGPAARVLDTLTVGKGPLSSREDQAAQIENTAGDLNYIGLDKKQAAGFETLLQAYKGGNVKAGDKVVASVSNNAAQNPGLAIALLHNLRDYAPGLYTKARLSVPKGGDVDTQMTYEETNRIGQAVRETPQIVNEIVGTIDDNGNIANKDGMKELVDRATSGDKEAGKALLEILRVTGQRRATQTLRLPDASKGVR